MVGIEEEVECTYCGGIIQISKAVKVDHETGEYIYACPGCAKMSDRRP